MHVVPRQEKGERCPAWELRSCSSTGARKAWVKRHFLQQQQRLTDHCLSPWAPLYVVVLEGESHNRGISHTYPLGVAMAHFPCLSSSCMSLLNKSTYIEQQQFRVSKAYTPSQKRPTLIPTIIMLSTTQH